MNEVAVTAHRSTVSVTEALPITTWLSADTTAPLPIAVEFVTVAREVSAYLPTNVLFDPVVNVYPALEPIAVFKFPVV